MKNKFLAAVLAPFLILSSLFLTAAPANAADLGTVQAQILSETNAARAANGLAPLTTNSSLASVAQNWSHQQFLNGAMSHNPNVTSQIPAGWYAWGENVATGYDYTEVTTAWMNSPEHRANILSSNFTEIGIGYWEENGQTYYTQVFATYSPIATAPSQPNNVNITGKDATSITFAWNAPYDGGSPITGYVARATDTVTGAEVTVNVTGTTATISGLHPGRVYAMSVKAVNARGSSSYTNPVNIQTNPVVPDAPTVQSQSVDGSTATVTFETWDGGSYINTWTAQLNGFAAQSGPSNTFTFSNLEPGVTYTGKVTATNDVGTSTAGTFTFSTPVVPPSTPGSPTIVQSGNTQLTTTWKASTKTGGAPISGYNVKLFKADDNSLVEGVTTPELSTVFNNVVRGYSYYTTVSAVNTAGESSPATTTTLNVPVTLPTDVQNVTASLDDERKITVDWDAPADNGGAEILSYVVRVFVNGAQTPADTFTLTPAVTEKVFSAPYIKANTSYRFVVTATNTIGETKAVSTETVDVPKEPIRPSEPQNVKTADVTSNTLNVTWEAPADNGGTKITGYVVNITGPNTDRTVNVSADTFDAAFTGLTRGTDYTVTVYAVNKVGNSDVGSTAVTTKLEKPSAVSTVEIALTEPTTATVTWVAPTDNGGAAISEYAYVLYRNGEQYRTGTTSGLTAVFSDLDLSSDYRVEVTANNGQLTSDASASNTVATATPPGLAENVTATASAGKVVVTWDAPADNGTNPLQKYTVALLDVDGATVSTQTVNASTTQVSFTGLKPNTVYSATVITASDVSSGKTAASNTVTTPVIAPSAPRSVKLTLVDDTNVKVAWSIPASDGGTPVTGYTVTAYVNDTEFVASDTTSNLDYAFTGLNPNTKYTFTVVAQHTLASPASAPVSVTTNAVAPSAPQNVKAATNGDRAVKATWEAPAKDGGAEITQYVVAYITSDGAVAKTVTVDSDVFSNTATGLTRGVTYTVQVKAVNAAGTSVSGVSDTVTVPAVAPTAVVNADITAVTGRSVKVTWNAPFDDGGSAITSYRVRLLDGDGNTVTTRTVAANATTATFTGVNPANQYKATIAAVNNVGVSPTATTNTITTPAVAPSAPRNVTADPSSVDATITVAWDAPADNGGATVTRYDVVATNTVTGEERTAVTNGLTVKVGGLDRGATYNITVTATNSAGTSPAGTVNGIYVNPIAPSEVQDVNVDVNSVTATVTWKAPEYDGGAAVTGYTVELLNGDDVVDTYNGADRQATFSNLTPVTDYKVSVVANNTVGSSTAVVGSFTSGAVAPDAVTDVTATADDDTVTVEWVAPEFNGGSSITSYTVNLVNVTTGGTVETVQVTGTNHSFTGVARGETYRADVAATNVVGSSEAVSSNDVDVAAIAPTAPRNVEASVKNAVDVTVTWVAPSYNGGASVIGYTVQVLFDGRVVATQTVEGLSAQFTGLDPATTYVAKVTAMNDAGESQGATVPFVTDAVAPSAPRNVRASVEDTTVNASWDAPETDGGAAVTSYTAQLVNADTKTVVHSVTVTGKAVQFVNNARGVNYDVVVTATNSAGTSPAGTSNSVYVAPVAPSAPVNVTVAAEGQFGAVVTWSAPTDNGGAPVVQYVVTAVPENGSPVSVTVSSETTSYEFAELNPNSVYKFNVLAVNSAGDSAVGTTATTITTAPEKAPAAPTEKELADASSISVTLSGDVLTVDVPFRYIGEWVYGYAYSEPVGLGWSKVALPGQTQFSISGAGLQPGEHRLAVLDADGNLVGVAAFTIAAAPVPPVTPGGNGGTDNTNNTPGNTVTDSGTKPGEDKLSETGGNYNVTAPLVFAGSAILIGSILVVRSRRRRENSN